MIEDYAYPSLMAERCLKDVHNAFLDKNYRKAEEKAQEAATWLVELRIALRKARQDAEG